MEGNTRGNIVHRAEKKADNTAEEETKKENRKKKKRRGGELIVFFFSVHHVSLTLPVDPGACAHVSSPVRICFCYYMIGCAENIGKPYLCVHSGGGREGKKGVE